MLFRDSVPPPTDQGEIIARSLQRQRSAPVVDKGIPTMLKYQRRLSTEDLMRQRNTTFSQASIGTTFIKAKQTSFVIANG